MLHKYRIAWRSIVTGFQSHGEYLFETEDDVKGIVDNLNIKFADMIVHWYESC